MSKLTEQVKIYSASPSDMSPPIDDKSFCVDFVLAADYAALQAERDQLAAECAALKKSIPPLKMVNDFDDSWDDVSIAEEVGFNHAISTILRNFPKTPATDRFLAEQRAKGVEMFALMFAEEAIKSNNITTGWRARASRAASEYADALREDAAQLRNEVKV